jgi:V8-like Glu-specific endopeptidase
MVKSIHLLVLICFLTPLSWCQTTPSQTLKIDGTVLTSLSRTVVLPDVLATSYLPGNSDRKWTWSYTETHSTSFLRLHVILEAPSQKRDWWLRVTSDGNDYEERIDQSAFDSFGQHGSLWTQRIPGHVINAELRCPSGCDDLRIRLDKYHYESGEPATRAIVGTDDRVDLLLFKNKQPPFYDWGQSVGAVLFQTTDTQEETNCTTFLVAPSLVLTNNHCVSEPWQIKTALVVFGYKTDEEPKVFKITEIVQTDAGLDFSLLRLGASANTLKPVQFDARVVKKGQKLVLIQYPAGKTEMISVKRCEVQSPDAPGVTPTLTDFYHLCDSESGASGSPVMDAKSGEVVGLHHFGRWDPSKADYHNLGVKIGLILNAVKASRPDVAQEIATMK